MASEPFFTLALCTHNHSDRLARPLHDLDDLTPPSQPFEFLVIDNASTDDTPAVLTSQAWHAAGQTMHVVHEAKLGIANARNRALNEAQGTFLLFIDDDETPASDWLVAMEKMLIAHAPDAIGGRIEVMFEGIARPPWLRDELLGFLGKLDHGPEEKLLTSASTPTFTGNAAYRVATLREIGGFDPMLGRRGNINLGGEDTELYRQLVRLGHMIWWAPRAVVFHRIQALKIDRRYFLELHYRQGYMEAARRRGDASRVPPKYIYGQLIRAIATVWAQFRAEGRNSTLRKEMNVAYFVGQIAGWAFGPAMQDKRS